MDGHHLEGRRRLEVAAEHHHPGHPEEDDVVAGDQHRRRVEGGQVVGLAGPAEGRERPQPAREPGVEHVLVLGQLAGAALGAGRRVLAGHGDVPVRAVPGGDAVAPPQLAGHAPVADLLHPAEEGLLVADRLEPGLPGADRLHGLVGQRPGGHEPLQRQAGLDLGPAAVAVADRVRRLGDPLQQAQLGQGGLDLAAGGVAVQALEPAALGVDDRLLGEDVDRWQALSRCDLVVVGVMGRGDLDRAGAELAVDGRVGHDRDQPVDQGQAHRPADQALVAGVVGVDGHGGVAQHRLGPRGRHPDPARPVGQRVAQVGELARDLLVLDLDVGQGGQAAGAPVDDPPPPVQEPLLVQGDEHLADGPGQALVHGEALPRPVDRVAEALHLAEDAPAGLGLPGPDPLHERLPAQVEAGLALLGELPLDHVLGGDAGVVHARQPQHLEPAHAVQPGQVILVGVVEGVADVERPGHIGRRKRHAEVRPVRGRVGPEPAAVEPALVGGTLDRRGVVGLGKLGAPLWGGHG